MTEDLHALVRDAFQPVRLTDTLDDVTTRGQRLRRRRQAGTAMALVSVLALAAGLVLSLPSDQPEPNPMQLAAWSVRAEPDGAVLVTIRDLSDAEGLTAELEKAGIPALVEFKEKDKASPSGLAAHCAEDGQENSGLLLDVMPPPVGTTSADERFWTIRRDRMPAGMSLHFVIISIDGGKATAVNISLVEGDPIPCRLVS